MNYESWKALPSSFRNGCSIIPPSSSQAKVLVTDWELLLNKTGTLTQSHLEDTEQVWAEADGIRAPLLDKEPSLKGLIKHTFQHQSLLHPWDTFDHCPEKSPWNLVVLSERSRDGAYRWKTTCIRNINRHALSLIHRNQEDAGDLPGGNATGQGLTMSLLVGSRWDESFQEFLSVKMRLLYLPASFHEVYPDSII